MRDILSRAFKTFIEAFFAVLIPEIAVILQNVNNYDWTKWYVWLAPIIAGCIGTAISITWNSLENYFKGKKLIKGAEDKEIE